MVACWPHPLVSPQVSWDMSVLLKFLLRVKDVLLKEGIARMLLSTWLLFVSSGEPCLCWYVLSWSNSITHFSPKHDIPFCLPQLLNSLVRKIVKHANHRDEVLSQQKHPDEELAIPIENAHDSPEKRVCDSSFSSDDDSGFMCTPGCSSDPTDDLEFYKFVATQIVKKHMKYTKEMANTNEENISGQQLQKETQEISEETGSMKETEEIAMADDFAQRKLMHMSLSTAIAIGLHNFPEGLATFVAVLANPSVGAVLGVAIAIHNIPEGLCVSLPVYYATGNRRKAFLWGTLSGITEPIAALVGWAVLSNSYSPTLFGVLFGLVAGMMVMISVRELLPTAHRYDPHDKFVTMSFLFGMAIMGLSLVLFKI